MTSQISVDELNSLIGDGAVRVVDGSIVKVVDSSWALDGTDMHALFLQDHIPGAVFFDIEAVSDHSTPLPHTAPSPQAFAEVVGRMGISETDHVIIYDRHGLFSAARVWWTFRLMGHEKVQVLAGGLPAWKAAGFALESGEPVTEPATYRTRFHPDMVVGLAEMRAAPALVLDARSRARFEGTAPEPRPGLRPGHMPGSRSLPFGELIADGRLKSREDLKAIFESLGVAPGRAVTTSCGSGVTAAILSMALYEIGHTATRLYDGSWSEWGQDHLDTPVITGAE